MMSIIAVNAGIHRGGKRASLVLDTYLNRIGVQAWAGYLSKEGCEALFNELKDKASRTSAVQILWQHDHRYDVLATIGHPSRFMDAMTSIGKKPVETKPQAPAPFVRRVILMARVAGLWHDSGKLMPIFQETVRGLKTKAHPIRHQTLSFYLMRSPQNTVIECSQDGAWNTTLGLEMDIASAVVLTHHAKTSAKGDAFNEFHLSRENGFGTFEQNSVSGLVINRIGESWLDAAQAARRCRGAAGSVHSVQPEHHALAYYATRLSLMMADHAVSSVEASAGYDGRTDESPDENTIYAKSSPWIPLDDHLNHVGREAGHVAHGLFMHPWPRLRHTPESMLRPVPVRFKWQEHAESAIRQATVSEYDGFFGCIIAETGSGKTQGGFRIMSALGGGVPRFTLGLGFGALAVQSGAEYLGDIGLNCDEVAIFVGHRHKKATIDRPSDIPKGAQTEREDVQFTLEGSTGMVDPILPKSFKQAMGHDAQMLTTPIVIMTIDHIMAAMEADRGGYVKGAARVVTADLLIDEIDSFSPSDLHAIGRLIYLAASFGRKVVVSSATTTPEIACMLFDTYRSGYAQYQSAMGNGTLFVGVFANQGQMSLVEGLQQDDATTSMFNRFFSTVASSVAERLAQVTHRRSMGVIPMDNILQYDDLFNVLARQAIELATQHHSDMPEWAGAWFSTGFARMNLVKNAQRFALWLMCHAEALESQYGVRIRLNCYTAALDSVTRKSLEHDLGELLLRKNDDWSLHPVMRALDKQPQNTLYIVITTPVIEVGRDYDFDWCILEPSSDMSIIQSAGRVLRHRHMACPKYPNVMLMDGSVRGVIKDRGNRSNYYGHLGPGFQQDNPLTRESWNKPWPDRDREGAAQEIFGASVYAKGIHAGYRMTTPHSKADEYDRQVIKHVHTGHLKKSSSKPLHLSAFLNAENPWRDSRFDVIKFRQQNEEPHQSEYIYEGNGLWKDSFDCGTTAVAFKKIEVDTRFILLKYKLTNKTSVMIPRAKKDEAHQFSVELGVMR
jgi:CRISPR-associated endonuclease/helicase Cas3